MSISVWQVCFSPLFHLKFVQVKLLLIGGFYSVTISKEAIA